MNDKLEEWWEARDARRAAQERRREERESERRAVPLTTRLRASGPFQNTDGHISLRTVPSSDAWEAADALDELGAECERLRAVVSAIRAECLTTLTSRLTERADYGEGLRMQATWILEIMDTGHVGSSGGSAAGGIDHPEGTDFGGGTPENPPFYVEESLPQDYPCDHCHRCLEQRRAGRELGELLTSDPELWPRMVVCPTCGNKRCPKATDHRGACTNSNEAGQPGSLYS